MDHSTNTNSSKQQQHEEEGTIFRSIPRPVSGMPAPAMSLPPLSMNMKPLGFAPLSAPKRSLEVPSAQPSANKKPILVWKVDATTIPAVPGYPLERTHLTCSDLTVDQIAERIARVLEAQENLQCVFSDSQTERDEDDEEERLPGRVDCASTVSDLKFAIQLYRCAADSAFTVELQRRRGDAMSFSAVRRAAFAALQGKPQAPTKKWSPPAFTPNQKLQVLPMSMRDLMMPRYS